MAKHLRFSLSSASFALVSLCLAPLASAQKPALLTGTRFGVTHAVPQTRHASAALLSRLGQQNPAALSVTAADFYEDSTKNLVTGYALGNGGAIALQDGLKVLPRVEEMSTKAAFQLDAHFIEIGIRPDFLKSADVNGDAHQDLIVASRGGSSIQVLLGDGKGNLTPQTPISVKGQITALTPIHSITGQRLIAAGVCGSSCSVNLFQYDGTLVASVPVDDKITILEAARLNGTASEDLIAGGSSNLVLIDGASALTISPRIDRLPIAGAVSAINGSFVYDTRGYRQIAVLTNDGTLHTLARSGIISQPPVIQRDPTRPRTQRAAHPALPAPSTLAWVEVETLNDIAQLNGEGTPTLLWSRVAGSGMDNVLILNVNGGAVTTVLHPVVLYPSTGPGEPSSMKALPARVEVESSSSGVISGAIAMRTAQDSRFGLVMARSNATPEYAELSATHTYYVGKIGDDAGTASASTCESPTNTSCSLRSALMLVDADATSNEGYTPQKADTVNVPTGNYILGKNGQADAYGNGLYHIEIYGPVNLIGTSSGAPGDTTITSSNNDKIFSENSGNQNSDPNGYQPPIDFYMSGITLLNGTNPATPALQETYNLIDNVGGLMDADTGISGYITMVNDVFENGTVPYGAGGGLFISDDIVAEGASGNGGQGNGVFAATGCTFSGNKADEGGGAISLGIPSFNFSDVPATFSGDTFTNNSQYLGTYGASDTFVTGQGGAIDWNQDDPSLGPPESTITTSTFTGNSTVSNIGSSDGGSTEPEAVAGGGAVYTGSAMEITNSTFTGNSVVNEGGAIYMSSYDFTAQIIGNVITGNSAKYGGGIQIQSFKSVAIDGNGLTGVTTTVTDNAIYGNTATSNANTKGLGVGEFVNSGPTQNAPVTATDNFWGCNSGPNNAGCDTAALAAQGGTLTTTPYAVLTATFSPITSSAGTPLSLTAGIDSDSAGNSISTTNGFSNLPDSLGFGVGGDAESLPVGHTGSNGLTTLSATFTAEPNYGNGTYTATLDNATVSGTFTVNPGAPTANSQSVTVAYASSIGITLTASGQGTITYTVATSPAHGTLSGIAPNLTYTASAGYVGSDSFTFTASNGTTSSPATVSITIQKIQPSISLSAPATANRGTASPLVATVTVPTGAPAPVSSVSFYANGTTLLGSAGLTATSSTTYTATLNAANLPAGTPSITATYPTDSDYLTATSSGQTVSVIGNYIWVGNSSGTTSAFDPIGSPYLSSPEPEGGYGVAIDSNGNVWSVSATSNSVAEFSDTGTVLNAGYTGGGLSTPAAIAIDGSDRVWIANVNNSVSVFNSSGQPVSASAYTGTTPGSATPTFSTPTSISIDGSGNLWIGNSGNNTVTELLGAATPTLAPLASGVAGNKSATRP